MWLAFGPVYQGTATSVQVDPVSGQVIGPDSVEVTRLTASYIEFNGPQAVLLLLVPIALTGLSVLAVRLTGTPWLIRKWMQWVSAIALFAACAVMYLSIGIFYAPSALALFVSACLPLPERTNE